MTKKNGYFEWTKKSARLGFRYSMELNFAGEDDKLSFMSRVETTKVRLAPRAVGSSLDETLPAAWGSSKKSLRGCSL